ncbi:MAG TPA: hypothetical protein DCO68_11950 [Methylophilaceae bacterium]|nr:hypothetical protein [Methylophilaceae bacterium]HAJ72778.1 hypothetical protein [Methylophilaceae bacterium]
MSIIAIAWRAHPDFPLIVLMNQDGLHDEALTPAAWWTNPPECFAGKDASGGTSLGITRDGRYAAVTAFRDNQPIDATLPAIGQLPLDYLTSDDAPVAHVRQFMRNRGSHPPFNLIVGSTRQAYYAGTNTRLPLALTQGVHTISNGLLDEKWPKCVQLEQLFGAYLKTYGGFTILLGMYPTLASTPARDADALPKPASKELTHEEIANAVFAMLADRTTYESGLPDTGVNKHEEERLSACFVIGKEHGTRTSSMLIMGRDGEVRFEERSFNATGEQTGVVTETWEMDPAVFSGGGD